MIPTAGDRLGPYEILGRLGRGGMGLVFRAWDARLHREVAIKLLAGEFGGQDPALNNRQRFLQEARAASALNHPNICTIFDIGEKDGAPYLVMELMQGETLNTRIERGPMPVDEIVPVGIEIADALGAAHACGIVHRDIKPANVFLVERANGERQIKILDFGVAKLAGKAPAKFGARAAHLTSVGETVGTACYMSPEQARGEAVDSRSDLFSLGVVLYEMATRRVPFQGSSNALIFNELLHRDPEPIQDWNDSIPRSLEKIVLQLLEKEADRRFQTAGAVSTALRELAAKPSGGGVYQLPPAVPLVRVPDPMARPQKPARGQASLELIDDPILQLPSANRRRQTPEWTPAAEKELCDSLGLEFAAGAEPGLAGASRVHPIHHDKAVMDGAPTLLGQRDSEVELVSTAGMVATPMRSARRRQRLRLGVAGLAAVGLGAALLGRERLFRPALLRPGDPLMVTAIENRTGDWALDGTVAEGLEIALAESPGLALGGQDAYRAELRRLGGGAARGAATPVLARQAAQAAGAKAYLYGAIRKSESGYTISVTLLEAESNRELALVEAQAARREEIPGAIDQLAEKLRARIGADLHKKDAADAQARFDVPLTQEATGRVDALHIYSVGVAARLDGRTGDAIKAFQSASALDHGFVQPRIELAWLYRSEHAEEASADEARQGETAADRTSSLRTSLLAQYAYEVNTTGDLEQAEAAIRRFVASYPRDMEGARELARVLRLEGRFSEAMEVAEQGIADDPYDADLYAEAELSSIALDRYQAALALEQQSEQNSLPHPAIALTAEYLAGRQVALPATIQPDAIQSVSQSSTNAASSVAVEAAFAVYLDNTGQLEAGADAWRQAAAELRNQGSPAAGGAWLLAQGALNRALAGQCGEALQMARAATQDDARGIATSFKSGMAAALCGDQELASREASGLAQYWPKASAVQGYYLPDLRAAMALGRGDAQAALGALRAAQPYDPISLTPYLRGLGHLQLGENQSAILDFQTVLGHRGTAVTGGSDVYPLAEKGLAQAYEGSGDPLNGAQASQRFAEIWQGKEDPGVSEPAKNSPKNSSARPLTNRLVGSSDGTRTRSRDAAKKVHHTDRGRAKADEAALAARRVSGQRSGGGDARRRSAGLQLGADDGSYP